MSNVKILNGFAPIVEIDNNAFNKMEQYIDQCNLEIGWLGCAERSDKGYYISDVFLFKQEVHSATTEITTEGLSEFAMGLMLEEDGVDKWNSMRVWGHSHIHMATFASQQDEKQMDLFTENNNDFFIRIIANKKGEYSITVYDYALGLIYEKLEYELIFTQEVEEQVTLINNQIRLLRQRLESLINPSKEVIDEIAVEMKEKVVEKKYTYKGASGYVTNTYNNYGYYGNGYPQAVKKNEIKKEEKSNDAMVVFSMMEEDEIELAYSYIMEGCAPSEIFKSIDLDIKEEIKLENMIIDYMEKGVY